MADKVKRSSALRLKRTLFHSGDHATSSSVVARTVHRQIGSAFQQDVWDLAEGAVFDENHVEKYFDNNRKLFPSGF